jgi:hypothetical protein
MDIRAIASVDAGPLRWVRAVRPGEFAALALSGHVQ